jgi:hypothetical protein
MGDKKDQEKVGEGSIPDTQEIRPGASLVSKLARAADTDRELTTTLRSFTLPDSGPAAELPRGVRARLSGIRGAAENSVFDLVQVLNTIGRGGDATIVVRDPAVSTLHAQIYYSKAREWRIRDLGSTNGVLLNGSNVTEFALRNGDKLLLGDSLFVFEVVA